MVATLSETGIEPTSKRWVCPLGAVYLPGPGAPYWST